MREHLRDIAEDKIQDIQDEDATLLFQESTNDLRWLIRKIGKRLYYNDLGQIDANSQVNSDEKKRIEKISTKEIVTILRSLLYSSQNGIPFETSFFFVSFFII